MGGRCYACSVKRLPTPCRQSLHENLGSDDPFPVEPHFPLVTAQAAGLNPEKMNRYAECEASYSAWNLVACPPASPGTSGIGKSNHFFSISIALVTIGSMNTGLPL